MHFEFVHRICGWIEWLEKWQTKRLILLPFYRFIRSLSNKIHIFAVSLLCDDGHVIVDVLLCRSREYLFTFIHFSSPELCCGAVSVCKCSHTFLFFCFDAVQLSLANIGINSVHGINKNKNRTHTKLLLLIAAPFAGYLAGRRSILR